MAASEKEIMRRCALIREKMDEKGLKVLIVFGQAQLCYTGSIRYITNYRLTTRKAYLIFPYSSEPVLILPTLGQVFFAHAASWVKDIRIGGETESMIKEVAGVLIALGIINHEVGIVGLNTIMPHYDFQLLQKALPDAIFKDTTDVLNRIRWKKSQEEIDMIQEATDIADISYKRLLEIVRPGKNEMEVISEVHKILVANGVEDKLILSAKGPFFPGFITHPSSYVFMEGDHYIFSIEIAGPSGYWSQIIRPLCLGRTSPEYERLFEAGIKALEAGVSRLVAGNSIADVVGAIGEKVNEGGFEMGLWCGHGMGLDLGDGIGLFQGCPIEVQQGMVITLHPHLISRDGRHGMILGDTYVVEKDGARNFSSSLSACIPCI